MVNANIEGNYLSRFKINKIEKEQQNGADSIWTDGLRLNYVPFGTTC